jgi:hypothetical protein
MDNYKDILNSYNGMKSTLAENLNIFKILNLEYDEVRLHSRMLKFFIEQDIDGFLKAIENALPVNSGPLNRKILGDLKQLHIEKSVYFSDEEFSDGRIDLLLEFDDFLIIIENKIYAKDQNHQLIKYDKYAKSIKGEKYLIFYLTPEGKDPSEHAIKSSSKKLESKKHFYLISYKEHILRWLKDFEINSAEFKDILDQYMQTVKNICGTMSKVDEERFEFFTKNETVINELLKDKNKLDQIMAYSVENFLSVISCGSDNLWIYKNSTIVNDIVIDDMIIAVDTSFFLNKIICSVWMRKGDPRKLSDLAIIKNKRYVRQGLKNEFVIFEEKIDFHKIKVDELKNRLHEIYNQIIL